MSKRYTRRSAEQWAAIIDQQARSGMGVKEFCQQNKLGASTFSKWKQKLQRSESIEQKRSVSTAPAFHTGCRSVLPVGSERSGNGVWKTGHTSTIPADELWSENGKSEILSTDCAKARFWTWC